MFAPPTTQTPQAKAYGPIGQGRRQPEWPPRRSSPYQSLPNPRYRKGQYPSPSGPEPTPGTVTAPGTPGQSGPHGGINPGGMYSGGQPPSPGAVAPNPTAAPAGAPAVAPATIGVPAGAQGGTTAAPANPWSGVDPNSQWTGATARAELERRAGRPLTPEEVAQAQNLAGYNDPTGQAGMTGAQMNTLLQEAARITPGATYQEYGGVDAQGHGGTDTPGQSGPTWEVEDAPGYEGPDYNRADPYEAQRYDTYGEFRPPTVEEMETDPGYQFRVREGNRALENSAAAKGMLRGTNTLRDIVGYNQDLASQEYGNVYGRARETYGLNRDEYRYGDTTNRDEGRFAYGANRDENRYGYEQDSANAQLRYAPGLMSWQARNAANQRQGELGWDRDWQRETYNRDDARNRYQYGRDDDYRRWMEDQQNRRFLVTQGNY